MDELKKYLADVELERQKTLAEIVQMRAISDIEKARLELGWEKMKLQSNVFFDAQIQALRLQAAPR